MNLLVRWPTHLAWALMVLVQAPAFAQVFVIPRRAEKSHVVYNDFTWNHVELEVAPDSARTETTLSKGRIQFYFYERERALAEYAAASISTSFRSLMSHFSEAPRLAFPYVLYSAYPEFLQTHLFPVQEGILGVTSTTNLKLTLPFMGDHRLFQEISAHELAHQFTLQKIKTLERERKNNGKGLELLPLWLIEGLAEFYAKEGFSPETEMRVLDLLVNPNFEQGYGMLDFFDERNFSTLWTYQVGFIRCLFLEETYGAGFLQRVLDATVSPKEEPHPPKEFKELLENLTRNKAPEISQKFETWLKRRFFTTYLATSQDVPQIQIWEPSEFERESVSTFAASPQGDVLLYKTLNPETFVSRLILIHRSAPKKKQIIAEDRSLSTESLHPTETRTLDIGRSKWVYVAESRSHDSLIIQDYWYEQRFHLGKPQTIRLKDFGLIAAYSPALSPDESSVAFIGLDDSGFRDVYRVWLEKTPKIQRLTHDVFSERQLCWGPAELVYSSNATSHGFYNLFAVNPNHPNSTRRVTTEPRDHHDPRVLPDGRVVLVAYDGARANLHEAIDDRLVQRSDVPTGVFEPHAAAEGLWLLLYRNGRRQLAIWAQSEWKSIATTTQPPEQPTPELPRLSLAHARPYERFSTRNWELGPIFGFLGGGFGAIGGQLMASAQDRLNNHALLLNVGVFGKLELTDGYLAYINQEKRWTYGFGAFQSLRFRKDKTFSETEMNFFSGERFFGAQGTLRYPFNRFAYVQGQVAAGGASYFLLTPEKSYLQTPELNPRQEALYDAWVEANRAIRFQTEVTLRVGFDTLRYHAATGPLAGSSVLLEGTLTQQPAHQRTYALGRLDAEHYVPLLKRTHLMLRGGMGLSSRGQYSREFFLYSFDTLRGVQFGDSRRLLGSHYGYSTAELQFPLNGFMQLLFLSDLEGVVAVDFGGVGDSFVLAWDKRSLNSVLGLNLGLGPFVFRLHFARNFDISAPEGLPLGNSPWVVNFSIAWASLGLPLGRRTSLWHSAVR